MLNEVLSTGIVKLYHTQNSTYRIIQTQSSYFEMTTTRGI